MFQVRENSKINISLCVELGRSTFVLCSHNLQTQTKNDFKLATLIAMFNNLAIGVCMYMVFVPLSAYVHVNVSFAGKWFLN